MKEEIISTISIWTGIYFEQKHRSVPNSREVVIDKYHIRCFLRNLGARNSHGNTNACLLKGRSIVHSITWCVAIHKVQYKLKMLNLNSSKQGSPVIAGISPSDCNIFTSRCLSAGSALHITKLSAFNMSSC